MNDERLGIVRLSLPDGRTVPLQFTWRAVDALGRGGVSELLEKAGSGEPGDMDAMARLIEASSSGRITRDELMDGALPFNDAFVPVLRAWTLAARRPVNASENPLKRLLTLISWRRLMRWLAGLASAMKSSGRPRHT